MAEVQAIEKHLRALDHLRTRLWSRLPSSKGPCPALDAPVLRDLKGFLSQRDSVRADSFAGFVRINSLCVSDAKH